MTQGRPKDLKIVFCQGALRALLALSCIFGFAAPGFGHGDHEHETTTKKTKKPSETGFKFTVGVSVSRSLAPAAPASTATNTSSGSEDHSGHQMLLHGGANDGDGGGGATPSGTSEPSGGSTAAPAFDPTLTARADYGFTKKIGLGLSAGYGFSSGLQDPEIGPTLKLPVGKGATLDSALTASFPASKASRLNYKLTSIKLVTGPTYSIGRFSLGVAATVAYAWYSKTVIVDPPSAMAGGLRTPSLAADGFGLHGGAEDGDGGGASGSVTSPSGDNLASADREFSRYGARTNLGFKFSKRWRDDGSVGIARINHQFGASTWATDVTVSQISFVYSTFAAYVALALYKEALAFAVPSTPSASIGFSNVFQ